MARTDEHLVRKASHRASLVRADRRQRGKRILTGMGARKLPSDTSTSAAEPTLPKGDDDPTATAIVRPATVPPMVVS